jgi:branched-chain amino acid transport system ATP-binding protein
MQLKVKDISVHYGYVEALRRVSLEVEEGSIVALIGANGAGKTTVLRTISGLNIPTSGEIWFLGERINGAPPSHIVKMGTVHIQERRGLFPQMSVYENMLMGAYLCKDKTEIGRNLEKAYGYFPALMARTRQQAGSLSGGEQQMLAIARALMANPKLLLVDEPSTGLAPVLVETMAEVISAINRDAGVSILLVEQNVSLALALAKNGYVMETGTIVIEGKSGDLLNNEDVKKAYLGR